MLPLCQKHTNKTLHHKLTNIRDGVQPYASLIFAFHKLRMRSPLIIHAPPLLRPIYDGRAHTIP